MKFFLTFILVVLILRLVIKLTFPFFIKYILNKANGKFTQQFNSFNQEQANTQRPTGEVIIEKANPKNSTKSEDGFTDYEEIK